MNAVGAGLARFVSLRTGEERPALWSGLYFFLLMFGYYIIRPLRDSMGAAGSDERLKWLYMGTLAGTLLVSPFFSWLVSRYARRVFLPWCYHFFAMNLLVFNLLFSSCQDPDIALSLGGAFFLWGSIYNLFAVSVFWSFMSDLYSSEQAKRLFGFIALGGTLGAISGAKFAASLGGLLGGSNLMLVTALLLEACVVCILRLARFFDGDSPLHPDLPPGKGAWSGIRRVLGSPYLLAICLFMFLYTLSSTLIYFEQARIVRLCCTSEGQRIAVFAQIDFYVNLLAALTQFFLTARIIRFFGIGPSLAVLPLVTLLTYTWLAFAPSLGALSWLQTLRRAVEYALEKPCREMLYVVLTREEKYCAKNLIDTFVYRGGDALGGWVDHLLRLLAWGFAPLTLAMLAMTAVWVYLATFLGRRHACFVHKGYDEGVGKSPG